MPEWSASCDGCGREARKTLGRKSAMERYLRRIGWSVEPGRTYCPVCKVRAYPSLTKDNPHRSCPRCKIDIFYEDGVGVCPECGWRANPLIPTVYSAICEKCGEKLVDVTKDQLNRMGWLVFLHTFEGMRGPSVTEFALCPRCKPPKHVPIIIDNPRTAPLNLYEVAMSEEFGAVMLYDKMIAQSTDAEERKELTHIRDEELEHIRELEGIAAGVRRSVSRGVSALASDSCPACGGAKDSPKCLYPHSEDGGTAHPTIYTCLKCKDPYHSQVQVVAPVASSDKPLYHETGDWWECPDCPGQELQYHSRGVRGPTEYECPSCGERWDDDVLDYDNVAPEEPEGNPSKYRRYRQRPPSQFVKSSFRTVPARHADVVPYFKRSGVKVIVGKLAHGRKIPGPRGGRSWATQSVLVPKDNPRGGPKKGIVDRWNDRVVANGWDRRGASGAEAYLARYGKHIGDQKITDLANYAKSQGADAFARQLLTHLSSAARPTRSWRPVTGTAPKPPEDRKVEKPVDVESERYALENPKKIESGGVFTHEGEEECPRPRRSWRKPSQS